MLAEVQRVLERQALTRRGARVLVAVSGGADSVALLHALAGLRARLGLALTVAHLHHGLRGAAADADAAFVRRLARRLGLPFVGARADIRRQARAAGVSLEMAAREARYAFFRQAAAAARTPLIALAHTADDQAETVLLRLARGAGAQGLGGMEPVSRRAGLTLLRPLLEVTHAEAIAFLRARRLRWREDASNRDPRFLRNRVRHEVLPLLARRLNPQIRTALRRTATVLRAEDRLLDELAAAALRRCGASARRLAALPLALRRRAVRLRLLRAGVAAARLDFDAVAAVLALLADRRGSRAAALGGGWRVVRRYDQLAVEHSAPAAQPAWRLEQTPQRGILRERPTRPGRLPARATLSAAALGRSPLVVRAARAGDRMAPLGLAGTKKLQDIFTDAKVPREQRRQIPVVTCRGEIVWLPGYRVARGWAVPTARSRSVLLTLRAAPG